MQRFSNKNTNGRLLIGRETTSNQWGVALFSHLCNHYSLAKEAAIGRQELNAKLHRILWWWFWSWRHICGFAENRRNRRKWTPQGRGNSQKSGDDPIGQVLSTSSRVQTGSSELPCCRSGWSEKRPSIIHDSVFSARFSKFLALSVRIPFFFKCVWHTEKWTSLDIEKTLYTRGNTSLATFSLALGIFPANRVVARPYLGDAGAAGDNAQEAQEGGAVGGRRQPVGLLHVHQRRESVVGRVRRPAAVQSHQRSVVVPPSLQSRSRSTKTKRSIRGIEAVNFTSMLQPRNLTIARMLREIVCSVSLDLYCGS